MLKVEFTVVIKYDIKEYEKHTIILNCKKELPIINFNIKNIIGGEVDFFISDVKEI